VKAFEEYNVLSKRELESRYDVWIEQYSIRANIEAEETFSIGQTLILPAGLRQLALISEAGVSALEGEVRELVDDLVATLGGRWDWAGVEQYLDPGIEYCREHGLEAWLKCLIAEQTHADLVRGRWGEAAERATAILEAPRDSVVGPRHEALLVLALVRARRGDPQYWPLLDEAMTIACEVGDLQFTGAVAAARAEVAWLEGRTDAIVAETQEAFDAAVRLRAPRVLGELALWRRRGGDVSGPPDGVEELYRVQLSGDWQRAADTWRDHDCSYDAALALTDHHLLHLEIVGNRLVAAWTGQHLGLDLLHLAHWHGQDVAAETA